MSPLPLQGFQMSSFNLCLNNEPLEDDMILDSPLRAAPAADPGFIPHSDPGADYIDARLTLPGDLQLDSGQTLHRPRLAYRLVGPPGAPVIALLGGISASRCAWQPAQNHRQQAAVQGWWQNLFGPEQGFDTSRYRLLSFDYLGGNGESSSPRGTEFSERAEHPDASQRFPAITTRDQARALAALLDELEITQLESVIGASYGGMVALAFGEQFPELTRRLLVICAAHESWPLASGWRHVQREILSFALRHHEPETGLKLARALAVTTYRSGQEFSTRFGPGAEGGVVDYLEHCGESFSQRFDPQAYLCLSQSIDSHRIDPERVTVPVDLIGFSSDQIVPPDQIQELYGLLAQPRRLVLIPTLYGHDAFLKEDSLMTQHIKTHLETCK